MNTNKKYIGINQRVPFAVLDRAIHHFTLNEHLDKERIFQHMQEFTAGVNRARKATAYAFQILNRQITLLEKLKKTLGEVPYDSLRIEDRKAFCLCLLSLTYPITYDLLVALAQGFKVQRQINKQFISEKVMSIYGSNRTVDIAIDALLPMIIELNTIQRDKISLYSLAPKPILSNKFIIELVVYSDIKLSGTKSLLMEEIGYKPWYSYFDISIQRDEFHYLIVKKESLIGNGYLNIGGK